MKAASQMEFGPPGAGPVRIATEHPADAHAGEGSDDGELDKVPHPARTRARTPAAGNLARRHSQAFISDTFGQLVATETPISVRTRDHLVACPRLGAHASVHSCDLNATRLSGRKANPERGSRPRDTDRRCASSVARLLGFTWISHSTLTASSVAVRTPPGSGRPLSALGPAGTSATLTLSDLRGLDGLPPISRRQGLAVTGVDGAEGAGNVISSEMGRKA